MFLFSFIFAPWLHHRIASPIMLFNSRSIGNVYRAFFVLFCVTKPKYYFCVELNEIFSSTKLFQALHFEQFQKLVAFLLPIFRNVDGSWRVTSKLRGSTLIQVARRCSKVFQRFSASLVRVGDVQGVSRRHAVRGKKGHTCVYFWGCRKKWKNSLSFNIQNTPPLLIRLHKKLKLDL